MKFFLDCEFIENGKTIDLISIGIVSQDGREYHAVNADCQFHKAGEWVKANVLKNIGHFEYGVFIPDPALAKPKSVIAQEIVDFVGENPEFWGEWCSYDWVCLCQLYGTMMDLPSTWPMRCRDVVQTLEDELCLSQSDWPESLEVEGNHSALLGAHTVKARYEWCRLA